MCCLLLTLHTREETPLACWTRFKGLNSPRALIMDAWTQQVYFSCFSIWNSRFLGGGKPTEPTALVPPTGLD